MKSQKVLWCAVVAICLAAHSVVADAVGDPSSESTSAPVRIDLRKDIGGRLVRGTQWMSPKAVAKASYVRMYIDNRTVSEWSTTSPYWNTTRQEDGWYVAMIREDTKRTESSVVVMNRSDILIHGGALSEDESWASDKVHLVQDWVRIPDGVTLNIASGAIVKFCHGVGIVTDGTLNAQGAVFTCISDASVGGDTNFLDPLEFNYDKYSFAGSGNCSFTGCDFRMLHELPCDTIWQAGSVHTVHGRVKVPAGITLTIAPGAIVKLADGAELYCENGGTVIDSEVIFTHLADDSAGGDTNGDGNETQPVYGSYQLTGFTPDDSSEIRYISIESNGMTVGSGETKTLGVGRMYQMKGDILVQAGGRLVVEAGVILKMANGLGITVQAQGELVAKGTMEQKIIFTSAQDGTVGVRGDVAPAAGDWKGMTIGGSAVFEHVRIAYGGVSDGVVCIQGGNVTLQNSTIINGRGTCLRVSSGQASALNSLFLSSESAVSTDDTGNCNLVNCVVYDMENSLNGHGCTVANTVFSKVTLFGLSATDEERVSHCLFYNATGQGEQGCTLVGLNGNLWGAPGFADAANENFVITASSPCVDAGDGGVCPALDYYGNIRMDVLSVKNLGTESANGGVPDIGIYEVSGSIPMYMEMPVVRGWNQLSMPFVPADTEGNRSLWNGMISMVHDSAGVSFTSLEFPKVAGQVVWCYSQEAGVLKMKYWSASQYSSYWRKRLSSGWYILGVAGESEFIYTGKDITELWHWDGVRWVQVERGLNGFVLEPGIGYMGTSK